MLMVFESFHLTPPSRRAATEHQGNEGGAGTLWFMMLSAVLQPP